MTEYALGLKNGINYPTNINGKSLLDIINSYCCQQNKDNKNQSKDNLSQNKSNEELSQISKQLTKIETLLNKLNHMSNNVKTFTENNYRLIGSPPIISTSSPLFINTIGLNSSSTPVINNKRTESVVNQSVVPNTPLRSEYNSPRRKRTPRRRILSGSSPFRASLNTSIEDSTSDTTLVNTSSDQLRDESEPQLRIDINEPLVQPEFIVEELINFEPLHDVLAENINKLFNNSDENCDQNKDTNKETKTNDQNIDPNEIRINDEVVNNILSNLESAPEFNTILDIITEKELQMTPYKNLPSVETTSSSASSLNTPQTPQIRVNAQKSIESSSAVIKNLMPDLKTPEKTVTLYAARSPSEARITPVKVTPVKVFRTDLTQDFNFVLNDKNVPIFVPKVSLVGQDFDLIANSIANTNNTFSVSVQPNPSQSQHMTCVAPSGKLKGKPNVNFSKPASELQAIGTKRPDLIPRKILPKPTNGSRFSTTTIVPVCANLPKESVPKQLMALVNNNSNSNEKNGQNGDKSESLLQKSPETKDRTPKRSNSSAEESSPIKIRVCFRK